MSARIIAPNQATKFESAISNTYACNSCVQFIKKPFFLAKRQTPVACHYSVRHAFAIVLVSHVNNTHCRRQVTDAIASCGVLHNEAVSVYILTRRARDSRMVLYLSRLSVIARTWQRHSEARVTSLNDVTETAYAPLIIKNWLVIVDMAFSGLGKKVGVPFQRAP